MKTLLRPRMDHIPTRYTFNVSKGGQHVCVIEKRGAQAFHDAETLFELLQGKFTEYEGFRIDVTAHYEYGRIVQVEGE
jgi:hypothetical protein